MTSPEAIQELEDRRNQLQFAASRGPMSASDMRLIDALNIAIAALKESAR